MFGFIRKRFSWTHPSSGSTGFPEPPEHAHSQDDYAPVGQQGSWLARLLTHRSMELLGLCLLVLAVCIGLSLFTYNPDDPSFNAATGHQPTNLLGRIGATIADSLIEWLGLGSILPIVILLAWTWRLVRYHHINAPVLRLISACLLLPAVAFLIGSAQLVLPGLNIAWPSSYGLGGSCGVALARYTLNAMEAMMGAAGELVTLIIALLLVGLLMPLTLNLHGHEWRALGRVIWFICRLPVRLFHHGKNVRNTGKAIEAGQGDEPLYAPYTPNGPLRPRQMMTQHNARPSGFLRYHNNQNAAQHARRMAQNPAIQSWISPPASPSSTQYAPPAQATSHPSSMPATATAEEEETNPYRTQLRHIQRDSEREEPEHNTSIIDADYSDIDEEEIDTILQAEQPRKRSFLERLTGKHASVGGAGSARSEPSPEAASLPNAAIPTELKRSGSNGSSSAVSPFPSGRAGPYSTEEKDVAKTWETPSLDLLDPPPPRHLSGPDPESLNAHARLLEGVLNDYGVQGRIRDYHSGPVVTLYELEPAPGVRTQRVIGLSDDIARSLSVLSVRIATIPGRNVIGIEVPNPTRETVYFPELLHTAEWRESKSKLELALGKDIGGKPIYADLAKMPHLLVAGTTGSGKSVGINAMILSLLYRLSPEECRLIMIDPKILELSIYEGIPHLMTPVVTEPAKAVSALKWAVQEMDRRYRLIADHQVRNISGYNDRIRRLRTSGETPTRRVQTGFDPETGKPVFDEHRLPLEHLPYIVVVIDEMADLMMAAGKEIEAAVLRLAQKARAAGIHVIMATQRPSVDVITGVIKANFPTRISFQVTNKFDSRTILQEQGAEQLLGRGDMLFMQGGGRITRVHGPFISDEEVERVVEDLRSKGQPVYNTDVIADEEEEAPAKNTASRSNDEGSNDLYDQAVELVMREKKASTSFIQRHLSIGYNRAANIIDQMEKERIIGPANHVGRREILKTSYHSDDGQDDES